MRAGADDDVVVTVRPDGEVDIGDVLLGKYRVERVLGTGGMGRVLEATHLDLHDRVAVKLLLPQFVADPAVVSRFVREARAVVKIRSEHVCRVLDVGKLDDETTPYLLMEYLEGSDLKAALREKEGVPVEQAVDWVMQACMALAHAHRQGIIHRDIKPANLFLAKQPDGTACLKVLDFGISKVTGAGVDMLTTNTHAILGTPYYMAPEQLRAARLADHRSDVYSLGVVLYEALTGFLPFDGDSLPELSVVVLTQDAPPLREKRADIPADLERIVLQCLEKDPSSRIGSAAELALALAPFGPPGASMFADKIARVAGYETPSSTLVADRVRSSDPGSVPVPISSGSSVTPAPSSRGSTPSLPSALSGATIAEKAAFERTAALADSVPNEVSAPIPISVRVNGLPGKTNTLGIGAGVLGAAIIVAVAFGVWKSQQKPGIEPLPVTTASVPSATVSVPPPPPPTVTPPPPTVTTEPSTPVSAKPSATPTPSAKPRPTFPVGVPQPSQKIPITAPTPSTAPSVPRITTDRHG